MNLPADLQPYYDACIGNGRCGTKVITDELFSCLLRLREVRAKLDTQELTITSDRSKIGRANPLLAVESALRMQFSRLAKQAGLRNTTLPRMPEPKQ